MHNLHCPYPLVDGKYGRAEIFPWHEELQLLSLPGMQISLWEIFERDRTELNMVKERPEGYRVR